jgi:NAD(P)-dependent dehydrogenase (short-subunit alcohol dehydrogenase family)
MKALVTGASRGIGASIAKCLREAGHEVFDASRSTGFDLEVSTLPLLEALESWGQPQIVVHNVGGALGITEPFTPLCNWHRVFRLNLDIAVELNNALIPTMQAKKWGRVVHISSVSSLENQGTLPYCAAKAALNAYTRSLGRVVAKDGVNVSAVLPGAVWTEGGYWDDKEKAEKFVKERMAIGRLGTPDEIGEFVAFLCSPAASFVVGSSFLIDGGQGRAFEQRPS